MLSEECGTDGNVKKLLKLGLSFRGCE